MSEVMVLEEQTSNIQSNTVGLNEITPKIVTQTIVKEQVEANLEKGISDALELNKTSSEQTIPQHLRKLRGGGEEFWIECWILTFIPLMFFNLGYSIYTIYMFVHSGRTPGRIATIVMITVFIPLS
ncbi:8022_t:CDS:1 [Dentiscutata erythropus]|uniref:8022_t:CDS:1 n=1 Tax=Dentiscutata erythropus TaxID=1348616 RepID=A0A9N9GB03_9GLOM|nr:8022_t:CDS:1 [Dentiscutata erythropus]